MADGKKFAVLRQAAPGVARSTVNALVLSWIGWTCTKQTCPPSKHVQALELFLAYLMHDTWKLSSKPRERIVDLIHHVASMVIVYIMASQGYLNSHVPFLLLLELSTIFLNVCKLYDSMGATLSNKFYLVSTLLFGVSFVTIRVIWFGARLFNADVLLRDTEWNAMSNASKWPVRLLYGLQVAWLKPLIDKTLSLL